MASLHKSIHWGVELLRQGKHVEAADVYRKVLRSDPRNSDAMHLMAVALFQLGQVQRAIELAEGAVKSNARIADYHSNLGRYYLSVSKLEEASTSLERALRLAPRHPMATFNLALVRQAQNRNSEAEALFRRYLEINPGDASAHHHLGNLLAAQYRFEEALPHCERVTELQPHQAEAWNNLGNVEQQLGRWSSALERYQRALALKPDYADAITNRGAALQSLGRLDEAEQCYREALAVSPGMLQARANQANLLAARGQHALAIEAYRRLLEESGGNENLWNNLGNSCQEIGEYEEALACYERALRLNPNAFTIFNNIGNCYRRQGRHRQALDWYEKALGVWKDFPEALNNIGVTLQDMGRPAEAVPYFERALAAREGYVDPLINLSNTLRDSGRPEKAIECLRKAAEHRPDNPHLWNNLGCSLGDQGRVAEAIECYRKSLQLNPDNHHAFSNLLLNLHYLDSMSAGEIFRLHREYQSRFGAVPAGNRGFGNDPDPERPLRVGYVSADFRRHSVAFFLEPVLECHDLSQVEYYCYSDVPREDALTSKFRSMTGSRWRDIRGMNDGRFAAAVESDRIDVLVDLGGHTAGNRLRAFAQRLAPVQVTWLGYPNTTGLAAMDYRLTDSICDPGGASDCLHSEELVRLPDGFLCFRPAAGSPPAVPPPCLANGSVTFGSFNNMAKMSAAAAALWARVLHANPGSRLALKNKALAEAPARGRVIEAFRAHGIEESRILMSGAIESLEGHLSAYGVVDIALDSFPYHGTTTTCEALWMGVPVVSLQGGSHVSRVGGSLLGHAGLRDLCMAADAAEFVEKATRLARQPAVLARLRGELRERLRLSPLMDERGFTRRLEMAYREMWRRWCRKELHA